MKVPVLNASGKEINQIDLPADIFEVEINMGLMHQAYIRQMANARLGTHKTQRRADVSRTSAKWYRQKGTGRARAGMASSPLWRGGGKIFPSSPEENFSHKVNRKMYRAGIGAILSQLVRENRVSVVESFTVDTPKTKALAEKLKGMQLNEVMIITDAMDENLYLSARNLPLVRVVEAGHADPVSLMRFAQVVVTRGALAKMEEIYA